MEDGPGKLTNRALCFLTTLLLLSGILALPTSFPAPERREDSPSIPEEGEDVLILTAEKSRELALANNREARASRREVDIAHGKIVSSRAGALPGIDLTGAYEYMGVLPQAEFDSTTFSLGERDNYLIGVSLRQPLYKGGRVGAAIRAARHYREYAREHHQSTLLEVAYQGSKTHYDVLLARELYAVSQKTLELARKHSQDVKRKNAQGLVADYDLLRARVEVANTEARKIKRHNALQITTSTLLKTLGIPLEQKVRLTDRLEYVPIKADLESALRQALNNRPEIARQRLVVAMQKENITSIRADMKPTAYLTGTWQGGNATRFSLGGTEWEDGWYAGIELSIPVFDGLRTRGRVEEEEARLAQQELALEDLEETVKLEVKQAILSLEDAVEFIRSQEENVRKAEEGVRLAGTRYQSGESTQLELLDAREALAQAASNYNQAVYGHMLTKLDLERATGMLETW